MDVAAYFHSMTQELSALKDRVSNLIDERHQGEIGSWRESIVRSMLRRHLPPNIGVGQGFILTEYGPTSQIDVIVYDLKYPRLFQDDDLVIVTPDAVRAIVEVKSSTSGAKLRKDLRKLANAAYLCRMDSQMRLHQQENGADLFVGYFSFSTTAQVRQDVLHSALRNSVLHHPDPIKLRDEDPSPEEEERIENLRNQRDHIMEQPSLAAINTITLNENDFIRFWDDIEENNNAEDAPKWKFYSLPNMAFGYFIMNLVQSVSPDSIYLNREFWWPRGGKGTGEEIIYPASEDFDANWSYFQNR